MEVLQDLKFTHNYWAILLPCILMAFDIITGYYNAWKKNEVSSSKMRDGLGKKIAEIVYIMVGMLTSLAFGIKEIGYGVSLYVIGMELLSLAENCEKLGFNLPAKLKNKLNNNESEEK